MILNVTCTKGSYSKLTVTANETRVKLSDKMTGADNQRVLALVENVINNIDKSLLKNTLRGNFIFDRGYLYIKLRYNMKHAECIAYFCDDELGD